MARQALVCVTALLLTAPAMAMADSARFNIVAQPLPAALKVFAEQAKMQLLYQYRTVERATANPVIGELERHAALEQLLRGTGLEAVYSRDNAATIRPIRSAPASDPPPSSAASGAQRGDSNAGGGEAYGNSRDGMRLAQVDQGATSNPSSVEKSDQATEKKPTWVEEVVVTGSRIPTAVGEQVTPVLSYHREDIERSGQTTVADFLNNLPDVSISSSELTNQTGIPGQTTVQLHGLPVGTTLVLLDGRRVATSYVGFFDLSTIPVSAIDRVEILPVGASAIYGADALGGAVNIILRKDLVGFEANGTVGHATGTSDTTANFAWGERWERGSISIIGTYQDRGELSGSQREATSSINFPANAPTFFYVTDVCAPGNVYSLTGQNLPGLSSPQAGIPSGVSDTPTIQQFAPTAGKLNQCNFNRYIDLIPHSQREGLLFSGHLQIADGMDLFTEVMLSHDHAGTPQTPSISASSFNTTLGANNPYNPFGQDVGISFAYPGILYASDDRKDLIRPVLGVRGSLPADWHYEAIAYVTHDRFLEGLRNIPNASALQAALNSSDPATALNPFVTGAPGPQQLLMSLVDGSDPTQYRFVDQVAAGQGVLRGPLVRLPAGNVAVAFGAEYSRETQYTEGLTTLPVDLSRRSYAVFAEARVPLLSAGEQRRGEELLALTVAGRFDHTSDFGGKATWQSGLVWRPTAALSFTGSYGVSYRAPQLQEIGGALRTIPTTNFGLADPFRGNESVPAITGVFGPNSNLKPETGSSRTLGVVYSSQLLHGLDASLTYFTVDISKYIATPGMQVIVDNPNLYPGAVIRAPPTPQDVQQGFLGQITQINDLYFNFGDLHVAGVDANVRYAIDSSIGRFTPSVALANIFKWQSALVPNSPLVSYVGQAAFSPGFAPRWKGAVSVDWKRDLLSAGLTGRYIGRYKDYQDFVPNANYLGNFWIFDANTRFDIGQALAGRTSRLAHTYIALTAVNLFNKRPPFSYGIYPYDYSEYDIRGRFVSVQAGIKW